MLLKTLAAQNKNNNTNIKIQKKEEEDIIPINKTHVE